MYSHEKDCSFCFSESYVNWRGCDVSLECDLILRLSMGLFGVILDCNVFQQIS